jgi:hypothetical protein
VGPRAGLDTEATGKILCPRRESTWTTKMLQENMPNALAEFRFRRLGEHFLWIKATTMRFRYVIYCTLSEVRDYWRNKADGDA